MKLVYFVLGATGGIGSAVSRLLHERGAELVLAARSELVLQDLANSLEASAIALDGSSFSAVEEALQRTVKEHGRLDGIVNCAGSLLLKPAHRTSEEEYRDTLSANLDTAFAVVRAGAKAMMKSGGSIVLVSSAAARLGLANHEAIAAAKAGVAGLALSAAASYASRGIRVNVVAPGMTRTGMTSELLANPASEAASVSLHPLGRLGEPEEVARAIDWLLDPRQSWITGQTIGVDGGLATVRSRS